MLEATMGDSKARTVGRPAMQPEARMGAIAVRFPAEMLAEIDAVRADRLDAPDRSSMIRELVAEALVARRKGRKS